MGEWKEYKLGDFFDVKHGFAFKGKNITTERTLDILVTPGNFNIGGGFKSNKFKYYEGDYPKEYLLKTGDIVITMTDLSVNTDTLGYSAKIPSSKEGENYLHNQRIGLVEFKNDKSFPEFLFWVMRSKAYQNYIVNSASGTSIMHTSPTRIKDYKLLLPPLPEQKAIAEVLSSLDDKIDLLHRQNETLEKMAETLFRKWFVEDADDSWEMIKLGVVVKTTSGGTPSRKKLEYYDNGTIDWVKSKELSGQFIIKTEEKITSDAIKNSSAKKIPKNSILIAMYGATVGEYAIIAKEMSCNQAICALIPNDNYPYTYLYSQIKSLRNEIKNMAVGSAQQNISQVLIKQLPVHSSTNKILEYDSIVSEMFKKIENNQIHIKNLEKLRDTLLPKLISGEVRVGG